MILASPLVQDHFSFAASTASKVSNSSASKVTSDTSKAVRRLFATRGDLLQAPVGVVIRMSYIYSDWFTTSSPNAKDPHPIANGRRPHLFTTQLLLNRNPSNQSFPNAGHGKRLWLKRYSPPSFHPS